MYWLKGRFGVLCLLCGAYPSSTYTLTLAEVDCWRFLRLPSGTQSLCKPVQSSYTSFHNCNCQLHRKNTKTNLVGIMKGMTEEGIVDLSAYRVISKPLKPLVNLAKSSGQLDYEFGSFPNLTFKRNCSAHSFREPLNHSQTKTLTLRLGCHKRRVQFAADFFWYAFACVFEGDYGFAVFAGRRYG